MTFVAISVTSPPGAVPPQGGPRLAHGDLLLIVQRPRPSRKARSAGLVRLSASRVQPRGA